MSAPKCICDFDAECNWLGTVKCRGCGGDLCVCVCGGEIPCDGCPQCDDLTDEDDDETGEPLDWNELQQDGSEL